MEKWILVKNELPEIGKLVVLFANGEYNLAKLVKVTPEATKFFKDPLVWEVCTNKRFWMVKLYDKWKYVDYENI